MKITNSVSQINNVTAFGSLSNLSKKTVKRIHDIDHISSVGQRFLIGATALFIQPAIDLSNKQVDKKTREQSAVRTVARTVVGTTTGIAVRATTIKIADKLAKAGKFLDFDMTEKGIKRMQKDGEEVVKSLKNASSKQIKTYAATMGTILGLFVMLFTNFLVDLPLINVVQNKLEGVYNKYKESKEGKQNGEVENVSSK